MPRYTMEIDGEEVVREVSNPTEGAQLRAQGWKESKARTKEVRELDAQRPQHKMVEQPAGQTPATARAGDPPVAAG